MIVRINDLEGVFLEFIKNAIRTRYPNTDTSDNSPIVDFMGRPVSLIASEAAKIASDMEMRSTLENARDMSEEDLDDIGNNNYMSPRREGLKASVPVVFSFESVSETENTRIPEGLTLRTPSGLGFLVTSTYSYSPDEMFSKWSQDDMAYNVEVSVEAEGPGENYNVSAGEISIIEGDFTRREVSVVNNIDAIGGTDEESNEEYASRILNYLASRTLETGDGYEAEIKENFHEVRDLHVAGYGDPMMVRDYADLIIIGDNAYTDRHFGGKVDIYIRGSIIETKSVQVIGRSNNLPLSVEDGATVDVSSVVATNNRTLQVMTGVTNYTNENGRLVVTVPSTDGQWIYGDTLTVSYDYDTTGDGTFDTSGSDQFTIEVVSFDFDPPLKGVAEILNETRPASTYAIGDGFGEAGVYSITYTDEDLALTSREQSSFTLDATDVENGDALSVFYSRSDTVKRVGEYFDLYNKRVVTRDVLILESPVAYIHIKVDVKLSESAVADAITSNSIRSVVEAFIDDVAVGGEIDESDIVTEIKTSDDTRTLVDFVRVPLSAFHKTTDPDEAFVDGTHDGDTLSMDDIQYAVLHYFEVNFL